MTVTPSTPQRAHPNFLLAHLPSSDIDKLILGAPVLLEGQPFTHPTVAAQRRAAMIRKISHLPSLLIAAACLLVIMDLSVSGADPFNTWPLQATVSVITGWLAAITYLATFRTAKHKAFQRCAVIPVSTMSPALPALMAATADGAAKLTEALCKRGIMDADKLDYAAARRQLTRLTASLR